MQMFVLGSDQRVIIFPVNRNRNRFAEPTSVGIEIGIVCEFQNLPIGIGIIFVRWEVFAKYSQIPKMYIFSKKLFKSSFSWLLYIFIWKTYQANKDIIGYTRRYGPLHGPTSSSCGGLHPSAEAFFALRATKELFMLFWPIFGNFWCSVVTMVTFSSNLSNNNKKNIQKISKIFLKISKNPKIQKTSQKSKNPKNPKKTPKNPKKIQKSIKTKKNQKNVKNGQKIRKPEKISKIHLFTIYLFIYLFFFRRKKKK